MLDDLNDFIQLLIGGSYVEEAQDESEEFPEAFFENGPIRSS